MFFPFDIEFVSLSLSIPALAVKNTPTNEIIIPPITYGNAG